MTGVALITGGSRGYAVGINYVTREDRARRLADEIRAEGGRVALVQGDVAHEDDVLRIFDVVDRELGPLTALVNNAGITGNATRLEGYDAAAIRRILDVNVTGTLLCSREAVKRMSTKHGGKGGAIVNLSSIAAVIGGPNQWTAYAAAKGAINSFTVGLAREVAGEGIRVNAISPGLIDTEIHAAAGLGDRLQKMLPMIPMGRIGTPEECAEAILWLLSGEAAYMTGAILPLSGGR